MGFSSSGCGRVFFWCTTIYFKYDKGVWIVEIEATKDSIGTAGYLACQALHSRRLKPAGETHVLVRTGPGFFLRLILASVAQKKA
jgi:hypothetical protein